MERVDKPTISAYCKKVWYPLLTVSLGFLFCLVIIVLAYFTYQTAVGNISFCTLWTDIPGRLALFIMSYYVAGICGILPLPESCRLNWLPEPFLLYRLESWKSLFKNFYLLLFSFIIKRFFIAAQNGSETSPLRGSNEYFYEYSPVLGERSEPTPSANTSGIDEPAPITSSSSSEKSEPTPVVNLSTSGEIPELSPVVNLSTSGEIPELSPVVNLSTSGEITEPTLLVNTGAQIVDHVHRTTEVSGAGDMTITKSSDDFMSFDSPIGGYIVPMVKGKSSKPPYIPDSSISNSESSNEPDANLKNQEEETSDRSNIASGSPRTGKGHFKVMFEKRGDLDTPPRTPDVDIPLPNYPRFPWSLLKERHTPLLAKYLHRRNMRMDRNEVEKYTRRQKVEEERKSVKALRDEEASNEWLTDSDERDLVGNRPYRLPPPQHWRRTRFRGLTDPGPLRNECKFEIPKHRRAASDVFHTMQESCLVSLSRNESEESKSEDEDTKCCDESPNLQFKMDRIKTMLKRIGQNRQTGFETSVVSTSMQIEDLEVGKTTDVEDAEGRIPSLHSQKTDARHFVAKLDKPEDEKDSYFENV